MFVTRLCKGSVGGSMGGRCWLTGGGLAFGPGWRLGGVTGGGVAVARRVLGVRAVVLVVAREAGSGLRSCSLLSGRLGAVCGRAGCCRGAWVSGFAVVLVVVREAGSESDE